MAQPGVFLSYSSKDAAFTDCLEADLRAAGAAVYRISMNDGGEFQQRIDEALRVCEWVVLVLTTDALASTWVQHEIYAAIRLKHYGSIKEILPIQAGAVDYRAIPPLWGVFTIFDATGGYVGARDHLMRALGLSAPSQPHPNVLAAPAPPYTRIATRPVPPVVISPLRTRGGVHSEVLPQRLVQLEYAAYSNGDDVFILPPLCFVPAAIFEGEILTGGDPSRNRSDYGDDRAQGWPVLPDFQVARHPLTVAEYACFVRAEEKRLDKHRQPTNWEHQLTRLDHPVVYVSWRDATAYANWLAEITNQTWRLSTEAEWEKAASWDPATKTARVYPWGDAFDAQRCNTSESGERTTTAIGSYARGPANGASPCGAQDMAGNVLEWTSSMYGGRMSAGARVLRGGSWCYSPRDARTTSRRGVAPDQVAGDYGFRLVLAASGS